MTNYYVPKSIKLIDGNFSWNETITILVDGKEMKRKVYYASLEGLYIVIRGVKYGYNHFDK